MSSGVLCNTGVVKNVVLCYLQLFFLLIFDERVIMESKMKTIFMFRLYYTQVFSLILTLLTIVSSNPPVFMHPVKDYFYIVKGTFVCMCQSSLQYLYHKNTFNIIIQQNSFFETDFMFPSSFPIIIHHFAEISILHNT